MKTKKAIVGLATAVLVVLPMAPSVAKKMNMPLLTTAWYQEGQQVQSTPAGQTTARPNPFCPSAPITNTPLPGCEEGRLPVEVVNGDYEDPDKFSALNFDFISILPGSKVKEFTLTLLESQGARSEPVNAQGKEIKACAILDFFGEGENRPKSEAPKFKCSRDDAVATRKKVEQAKPKNGQEEPPPVYRWTFDLTSLAQGWVKKSATVTGVVLFPVTPKKPNAEDNLNWRVVFAGAKEETLKDADGKCLKDADGKCLKTVVPKLVYEDPKVPPLPPPPPPPEEDPPGDDGYVPPPPPPGDDFGSGSSTSTITTTDPGTTLTDSGTVAPVTPQVQPSAQPSVAATPEPAETTPPLQAAADQKPVSIGLPGYVWLGLLAGLIGFSLLRSTVLEKTAGIRPGGVLAQIQQMNAARRGEAAVAVAGSAEGPWAGMARGIKSFVGSIGEQAIKIGKLGKKG